MLTRTLSADLKRLARSYPVITLTGPRQSGKTTLCRQVFPDLDYINLESPDLRQRAIHDPRSFLGQHRRGAIFDEIQRAPELTSYLQGIVDEDPAPGRFVLTGSQQFEVTQSISQSLAGRTAVCKLLPFSYQELYGEREVVTPLDEVLWRGFYPRIHDQRLIPHEALSFYLNTYIERDLRNLLQIRNLRAFETFLRLCAANIGQLINATRIGNDCGVDGKTVKSWLSLLEASFILFELPPHFRNYRKRLVKSRKLYFWDVGLAAYLLGIRQPGHVASHPLRGALFENFVIADLLKARLHQVREEGAWFFRDYRGLEVDLLLEAGPQLLAVEIKSGETFHSSMLKGLESYDRLREQEGENSLLIYGGSEAFSHRSVSVEPYTSLGGAPLLERALG